MRLPCENLDLDGINGLAVSLKCSYEARCLDIEVEDVLENDKVDGHLVMNDYVYLACQALHFDIFAFEPDFVLCRYIQYVFQQNFVIVEAGARPAHFGLDVTLQALIGRTSETRQPSVPLPSQFSTIPGRYLVLRINPP